ncbi:MAG: 4Fe-4S dicluster domain-containing protein, partial [Clostridia bacterium]|nr:4Fe-4S dicluster domain-containing protein [Clostridia bacterium]
NMQQMEDNLSYMSEYKPLDSRELDAVERVCKVFKDMKLIPCTACRYCIEGCPKSISIPDLFACLNTKKNYNDWNADYYYDIHTDGKGKAKDCIGCGKCEGVCPQHLNIRALLKDVAAQFDVPRVRED